MSVVQVQAGSQEALDRAAKLLAGVEDGVERAARSAMQRTTAHLRTQSTRAIREKYAISAANIRANENVTVRYTYQDGVQASVNFHGNKIPLFRYDGAAPKVPRQDTGKLVSAKIQGNWSKVHPSVAASGHQLKGTAPERFEHAFVAEMASGHKGIFERTGGETAAGGDEIKELMGSSVAQMLGDEEVQEKLAKESIETFEARMDHEVLRILNGWGG